MSNIEIEKQISKIEGELEKDFSQYTERKLNNMLISLRIKLNEINVVSAWNLKKGAIWKIKCLNQWNYILLSKLSTKQV